MHAIWSCSLHVETHTDAVCLPGDAAHTRRRFPQSFENPGGPLVCERASGREMKEKINLFLEERKYDEDQ